MEKKEVAALMEYLEKQDAKSKIGYWKTVGTALLGDAGLEEKWCLFVQSQVDDDFIRGAFLDETLQIISMIKFNVPYEVIAQIIKEIPGGQTIIDDYLSAFIRPEILGDIQSIIDSKKL